MRSAHPVKVVTDLSDKILVGGAATPIRVWDVADIQQIGGAAIMVYEITDSMLQENGGRWLLTGGHPDDVYCVQ